MEQASPKPIEPGTTVEVRCRFDGSWSRGFVVAARRDDRYSLRRLSDGSVLPAAFAAPDLRASSGGPASSRPLARRRR